ncbi:MAG: hypothetical protein ACF8NJ_04510, partial [Phycisphaerales bacterium JB038]
VLFRSGGAHPQDFDLTLEDGSGNLIRAELQTLEFIDHTNHVYLPRIEGFGLLQGIEFIGDEFLDINTEHLGRTGTVLVTICPEPGCTLEDYLASGGLGDWIQVEDFVLVIDGSRCWGDLNHDWVIDQADLGILIGCYGQNDGGDLNGDGVTDQADIGILLGNYNLDCD